MTRPNAQFYDNTHIKEDYDYNVRIITEKYYIINTPFTANIGLHVASVIIGFVNKHGNSWK